LRQDVSPSNVQTQQAKLLGCLTDLREQTISTICNAFNATVDIYNTQVILNTDLEYTSRKIRVAVELMDANGNNINSLLPPECFGQLSNIVGKVTFGEISDFTIDENTKEPIAFISSKEAGSGVLTVTWNNSYLSRITNRDNNNVPTSIEILEIPYTFVGLSIVEEGPRRDASDVAGVK
jgi:hypothetical protein